MNRVPHAFTARACANIAFIKYWGNRPGDLNLPLNPSISMTLDSCVTSTTVEPISAAAFTGAQEAQAFVGAEHAAPSRAGAAQSAPVSAADEVLIGGRIPGMKALARTVNFLDVMRRWADSDQRLRVVSENSFPTGCGIASSASGFAALAAAAAAALGKRADAVELSRIARLGSGSAARSIMGGFVELLPGEAHGACHAVQLAGEESWPDLRDVVAILSSEEKTTSSAEGHKLAVTSELFEGRLRAIPARAQQVREAIRRRDLTMLGRAAEEDALSMHAVMMTSRPPLFYWTDRTVRAINAVHALRRRGTEAYFTIDAGPNVHILCLVRDLDAVKRLVRDELQAECIVAQPGPGVLLEAVR